LVIFGSMKKGGILMKKLLSTLALLLLLCSPSWGAVAHVQSVVDNNLTGVTTGNLVVVIIFWNKASTESVTINSVTANSQSLTACASSFVVNTDMDSGMQVWYLKNAPSGTYAASASWSPSFPSGASAVVHSYEFSGVDIAANCDAANTASGTPQAILPRYL
jgi:hypothetical protein